MCAASMEEQESTRILAIHQRSGHPGVRRTLYFVKQVSPTVSKAAVQMVVRACDHHRQYIGRSKNWMRATIGGGWEWTSPIMRTSII